MFVDLPIDDRSLGSARRFLAEMRPLIPNWEEIDRFYRARVFAELVRGHGDMTDEELGDLRDLWADETEPLEGGPRVKVPLVLEDAERRICADMFTLTFGTPQDVALRNYRLLLFLPADDATAQAFEALRR